MRDLTEAERAEAERLLADPIPYLVEGDLLTTTVLGDTQVVYRRLKD